MESTLKNMVVVLLVITLTASAAVGLIYRATTEPIAAAKAAKTSAALAQVLPPFDGTPTADTLDGAIVYTAKKGDQIVGYAVESATSKGFGGDIRLMTGFLPSGEIVRVEALAHNETPGLGDKIESGKSDFSVQFQGKSPATMKMSVRKDGGEVDAITASTISSRAYLDALNAAWIAFQTATGAAPIPADAASGATTQTTGNE